jgi:hypothetical protein
MAEVKKTRASQARPVYIVYQAVDEAGRTLSSSEGPGIRVITASRNTGDVLRAMSENEHASYEEVHLGK